MGEPPPLVFIVPQLILEGDGPSHYTKRQKSYGKTSLHKPVAIVKAIAIPFRKPKGGDLGSDRGSCANDRLRNASYRQG